LIVQAKLVALVLASNRAGEERTLNIIKKSLTTLTKVEIRN